jgi:hypothetical protein
LLLQPLLNWQHSLHCLMQQAQKHHRETWQTRAEAAAPELLPSVAVPQQQQQQQQLLLQGGKVPCASQTHSRNIQVPLKAGAGPLMPLLMHSHLCLHPLLLLAQQQQ